MTGNAGGVFVTPHAMRRFQERISPLPYNHALAAIIRSAADPGSTARPASNGMGLTVRTRRPCRLRLVVASPTTHGPLPAVVSVMRG